MLDIWKCGSIRLLRHISGIIIVRDPICNTRRSLRTRFTTYLHPQIKVRYTVEHIRS